MTEPHPQPEYIITEEELDNIEKMLKRNAFFQSVIDEHLDAVWNRPHSSTAGEAVLVYEYKVHLPLKIFPSITRRKLALNDIGKDGSDDFTRLDFELRDGDIIQVLREQHQREREKE